MSATWPQPWTTPLVDLMNKVTLFKLYKVSNVLLQEAELLFVNKHHLSKYTEMGTIPRYRDNPNINKHQSKSLYVVINLIHGDNPDNLLETQLSMISFQFSVKDTPV